MSIVSKGMLKGQVNGFEHEPIKVFEIISRYGLAKRPLLYRNIQKETDIQTEKSIYYNFTRLHDSSKEIDII